MSTSRLIVLGLVLLSRLLPAGTEGASGHELPARSTGESLERVTRSVAEMGHVQEAVSLPEAASTGWWSTVQQDIGRSEYQVT